MSAITLWWLTLSAGLIVAIVVGLLLAFVLRAARQIGGTLSEIWVVGQSVANNTAHVDLLRRSAVVAEGAAASLELSVQTAGHVRHAIPPRPGAGN